MSIPAGARLGPYEILAPLGAGGMGEVYRARDTRLAREVALKVLPEEFFESDERRQRFEREAKLLASLNHPGIATLYSFEEIPGPPLSPASAPAFHVLVMELLEGETLRARLSAGPLPLRRAVDIAAQIARGLAAAHAKGIVHRDLKPENLFVTKDGRVKILDFGLAKLRPPAAEVSELPTESAHTEAGVVLGTVGYMSPEQVKGEPFDARSDVFSFGAVLHEMLSGVRVFRRGSSAETMSAILHEEPPDFDAARGVPPALDRIVRHCLEKSPDDRFQSARDLAFDLEALATPSGAERAIGAARGGAGSSRRALAAAIAATALVCAGATALVLRRTPARPPSFRQITFRHGIVSGARFGSDGKSVLYSAAWEGGPYEVHVGRTDGPDSRPWGLRDADVLSVSASGEAALLLHARASPGANAWTRLGTLARASEAGGAPRDVLEGVEGADFASDGKELAVVRVADGRRRLEYPAGKVLYETNGWITGPRVSPRGDLVAFLDHPTYGDDGGAVAVVDRSGSKTVLTPTFESASGVAWSPDGSEIWFTAAEGGASRALRAVTRAGRSRVVFAGAGHLTLRDASRDGRVLLTHDLLRFGCVVRRRGDAAERDLAWFDASDLAGLSADGRTALFGEVGVGGGPGYSVYVRGTDGSPAVRLGEGGAMSLSPDGRLVLAGQTPARGERLLILPTGAGDAKVLAWPGLRVWDAAWLPDSRHFLVTAVETGHRSRVYLADAEGGAPRPLTREGYAMPYRAGPVDARRFLVLGPDEKLFVATLDGGDPVPVAGFRSDDSVAGPSGRDGWILVRRGHDLPVRLVYLDPVTGREEPFAEIVPADPAGITAFGTVAAARDGRTYGYSYARVLSDLFVVEGLK